MGRPQGGSPFGGPGSGRRPGGPMGLMPGEKLAGLMASAVSTRALGVPVPDALKNAMRAKMMKSMLTTIAARNRA